MKKSTLSPKNIVITGASGGIGAALAAAYAGAGITLHLQGRDIARLEQVGEICQRKGASVRTAILDVTSEGAMQVWLTDIDRGMPVDLVIANAGVSAGTGIHGEDGQQVREIFATNIGGVINTVQPLLPAMMARRRGQIALMASLASLRGLPSAPAYSASKACVRAYGEGLRGWLSSQGVAVSVICPGYVKTPMTETNKFPMPFIMSPGRAAQIIVAGLARNKSRIAFPLALYLPLLLLNALPLALTDPLFARLPAKPASSK